MALTRKMLKAMGIEDDKIDQIIEAHSETVDSLKADRDKFKNDAAQLDEVQRELDNLKNSGGINYKEKYEKEHSDFEQYKSDVSKEKDKAAKEKAYRSLLEKAGVSEKRIGSILKVADIDGIELDKDGNVKDTDNHIESIKTEWADFIVKTEIKGAETSNPPASAATGTKTREEIMKIKDAGERQKAIAENLNLFGY